jgi:hypothetical protein
MTIALVLDFPGATRQQYDEVVDRMHLDGEMEDGGRLHFAGSYGDGWRVIDIWESLEQFERFRDDKIIPITQEVGMAPPEVRLIEVAVERAGSGAARGRRDAVRPAAGRGPGGRGNDGIRAGCACVVRNP